MRYTADSEDEMVAQGERIAADLPSRAVVFLAGNLGAGKTTLAKGIVKGLGAAEPDEVASPTFTLIHEYGNPTRVYHIDLYRLDEPRQLATLGLDEIFEREADRKSTRLNSSHQIISYAVFCLKKKKN